MPEPKLPLVIPSGTYFNPERFIAYERCGSQVTEACKGLVPYGGRPMLAHVIEQFGPYVDSIYVCGPKKRLEDSLQAELSRFDVHICDESDGLYRRIVPERHQHCLDYELGSDGRPAPTDGNDSRALIRNTLSAAAYSNQRSPSDWVLASGCDIPRISGTTIETHLRQVRGRISAEAKMYGSPADFYYTLVRTRSDNYHGRSELWRPGLVFSADLAVRLGDVHSFRAEAVVGSLKRAVEAWSMRKIKDHPLKSIRYFSRVAGPDGRKSLAKILYNTVLRYSSIAILGRPARWGYFDVMLAALEGRLTRHFGPKIRINIAEGIEDIDNIRELRKSEN
ncbi:MAG: NTP transferase domain-containing protein [archaeon]